MNTKALSKNTNDGTCPTVREYSPAQELANNLPYMAMTVLGTAIFVVGFHGSRFS